MSDKEKKTLENPNVNFITEDEFKILVKLYKAWKWGMKGATWARKKVPFVRQTGDFIGNTAYKLTPEFLVEPVIQVGTLLGADTESVIEELHEENKQKAKAATKKYKQEQERKKREALKEKASQGGGREAPAENPSNTSTQKAKGAAGKQKQEQVEKKANLSMNYTGHTLMYLGHAPLKKTHSLSATKAAHTGALIAGK